MVCAAAVALGACGRIGFGQLADDAGGDDAPANDPDADGVVGTADNCPAIANADQANEDGDRFGDACDPCPIESDPDPVVDQDGDGVSDGCDPFPTIPGDAIAVFEGFAHVPTGAQEFGSWSYAAGTAKIASSLNSLGGLTWPITGNIETVATHVTIDALFGNLVARPVGVVHEFDGPAAEGLMCVFGVNPSNQAVVAIADNKTTAALTSAPTTATVGTAKTLRSRRTSTSYQCTDFEGAMLMSTSGLVSAPNRVGLYARSVSAHFDWVMIIKSP